MHTSTQTSTVTKPSQLFWIKRIAIFQISFAIVLFSYLSYLAINMPPQGWGSNETAMEGFHVGALESITGRTEPIVFNARDVGYYSASFLTIALANIFILFGLKIQRLGLIRFGIILNIIFSILSQGLPIFGFTMLVLTFQKKIKEYFKNLKNNS